uniref:Eukaryotic translation initiation factor 4H n=1 Tax=Anthurium amnicola TaxID=1678845 RepID=A0A1D1XC90_9ARAE
MSTTKPWSRIGAWAEEAEAADAAEAEELAAAAAAAAAVPAADSESFPSLREAASAKPKKKKAAAMSLSEFHSAASSSSSSYESRRLTPDEMMRLPTGPRQRSQDELEYGRTGLGGGFRSYGLGGGRRDEMGGGRRPYGGFDDEPMRRGAPPPRASDFEQMPSRADEVDNWASVKKTFAAPLPVDSGRHDRYEALGGRGGASRADDVDNWTVGKTPLPSRFPGVGSGFRDSAPSDSDRWVRGTGGQLPLNGDRERPRLVLDPPRGDAGVPSEPIKMSRPSPFGAARPREQVLAEKGVDWRKLEADVDIKKTSRPTSSHSSRPSSAQSSRAQSPTRQLGVAEVVKPRHKVNPFGDAKPREIVLQEQGKDWKKIDFELEHRGVDRPETEEERILKEQINHLNELLAKETETNHNGEPTQVSAEVLNGLQQRKENKERELEHLARELDDKVRFRQRASDRRPGSGSGRISIFSDRPSSQSGLSEDSRSMEFAERPQSRGGTGDMWTKAVDDQRSFQLGTEGGFIGNRNIDRSRSGERW